MNDLNFGVFCLIVSLLVVSSLVVGFTCGFGGFVLYVAVIGAFTWLYNWLVVSRPRYEPARAFVGTYYGERYYLEGVM